MLSALTSHLQFVPSSECLGEGAVFWVHIEQDNDTPLRWKSWKVVLEHEDRKWKDEITSGQAVPILKSPDLDGEFDIYIEGIAQDGSTQTIRSLFKGQQKIQCDLHSASMICIKAYADEDVRYWTVRNAIS